MGGQPSAAGDRLADDRERPAIGQTNRVIERRAGGDLVIQSGDVFIRIVRKASGLRAMDQKIAQAAPGRAISGSNPYISR